MWIWMCGNVDVEMWRCEAVELWRCVDVEMWRCGCVEMWMWRCGDLELKTLQSYAFGSLRSCDTRPILS